MKLSECAVDCGRSEQTVRRWMSAGKFPIEKIGLREIFVNPIEWAKFCRENNIKRKGG